MEIRNLGASGLRVSAVGLGCNNFGQRTDLETSRKVVHRALDLGITLFDTADIYSNMGGSENVLGTVLGDRRKDIVLATKYSKPMAEDGTKQGASRRYIMAAVEASLKRLKTDYIDLYQQHDYDPLTPIEESLRALDDLVRQGKVLYLGISDTPAWQVSRMQAIADLRGWSPLVALQVEYSLAERTIERDLAPMAQELGLGLIPWSPLAGGVLTGKYKREDLKAEASANPAGTRHNVVLAHNMLTERNLDIAGEVGRVADELGKSRAQVALAWTLLNPAVTSPIIGARTLQQLEDNLGALEVEFTDEQRRRLDEASAIDPGFPHSMIRLPMVQQVIFGGAQVDRRL